MAFYTPYNYLTPVLILNSFKRKFNKKIWKTARAYPSWGQSKGKIERHDYYLTQPKARANQVFLSIHIVFWKCGKFLLRSVNNYMLARAKTYDG